ncbi:MAG: hypothetical protein IIA45_01970 [Bacteroidetes bacterium]|nr:hypothetical protein [Bacteroidota bacterium]
MAKKKITKKKPKKRSSKYEKKLMIKGGFIGAIKALMSEPKKKKRK